jgi:hypothetical protein
MNDSCKCQSDCPPERRDTSQEESCRLCLIYRCDALRVHPVNQRARPTRQYQAPRVVQHCLSRLTARHWNESTSRASGCASLPLLMVLLLEATRHRWDYRGARCDDEDSWLIRYSAHQSSGALIASTQVHCPPDFQVHFGRQAQGWILQ